eukprot:5711939-Pyramimonas_sp.AAC.1
MNSFHGSSGANNGKGALLTTPNNKAEEASSPQRQGDAFSVPQGRGAGGGATSAPRGDVLGRLPGPSS